MKSRIPRKPDTTSWNAVATWYDGYLEQDADTYQSKVILPNLMRFLALRKDERVLDLACGQGFFSREFAAAGAQVTGIDIASNLIEKARKHAPGIPFHVAKSHDLSALSSASQDAIAVVLALENIEKVSETLAECARVLRPKGRIAIVLMHPAFRIPRESGWAYEEKHGFQYRTVAKYLSEATYTIDMNPGERDPKKKRSTVSFHRPLQWYMKVFAKHGFAVSRLEEWISHKESGAGPRKAAEDAARKEIPLFMCLELRKL